ncbi:MAG: hypothetical protein A3K75_01915 [Euryarchaeota archaeon RBG_13_61_15]|jgi:formiminotetrahydrofolate cyclodeaminase|nr:MAG: hypothetical protein A3K75_01915 [Euryarchaeota archaeon RBG_13_61_15]
MVLTDLEGLRSFCAELSSDQPSPGGGTASAAAGAMAASLLAMVCAITRKSKKHEANWSELDRHKESLLRLRDELTALAHEDARAYDLLVEAMRKRKERKDEESEKLVLLALRHATDIPHTTSKRCMEVLETAERVAEIGSKNAYSDAGVAVLLAEAGLRGALMNVVINAETDKDPAYVEGIRAEVGSLERRAAASARSALAKLGIARGA